MPSLEAAVSSTSNIHFKTAETYDVDDETAISRLLEVSTAVLLQGVDLIDKSLVSDEQLTTQSRYIPGSTIGMHSPIFVCFSQANADHAKENT